MLDFLPPPKKEIESNHKRSKWVEYWNSLEHTPKLRYGKDSYQTVHKFLLAHKKYQIGVHMYFPLSEEYMKKFLIHRLNRNDTPLKERTDDEMYEHIKQAALAFSPAYEPTNKSHMKGVTFFYSNYSKQWGSRSYFMEYVSTAPKKLEEAIVDDLEAHLTEGEEHVLSVVKDLFHYWNKGQTIKGIQEGNFAVGIAKALLAEFAKIPTGNMYIDRYFANRKTFMKHYHKFVTDNGWDGMPLGALYPTKTIWNKFIGSIQAEIGVDVFTGKRLNK